MEARALFVDEGQANRRASEADVVGSVRPPADTPLGGLILLHGVKQRSIKGLTTMNWTLGCISMENADVLELLALYDAKDRPVLRMSA